MPGHSRSARVLVVLAGTILLCPMAAGMAAAAAPPKATVSVTNSGYSPNAVTVGYGARVTWQFREGTHSVTDASRLGLFNSGPQEVGSTFPFQFINSGTFSYHSTVGASFTGTVIVPMTATPATGTRTTYFTVRWGSAFTPDGYNEQVQMKEPGARGWISFVYGTPARDATFRAVDWGNKTGRYQLRAKLFKGNTPGVSSGWSPSVAVTVH